MDRYGTIRYDTVRYGTIRYKTLDEGESCLDNLVFDFTDGKINDPIFNFLRISKN